MSVAGTLQAITLFMFMVGTAAGTDQIYERVRVADARSRESVAKVLLEASRAPASARLGYVNDARRSCASVRDALIASKQSVGEVAEESCKYLDAAASVLSSAKPQVKELQFARQELLGYLDECVLCHGYKVDSEQAQELRNRLEPRAFGLEQVTPVDLAERSRAALELLELEVRSNQDPDAAIGVVNRIDEQPELKGFFSPAVEYWKRDLQAWKQESGESGESGEPSAQELIVRAKGRPADRSAYVLWLRAIRKLHGQYSASVSANERSDALFQLGIAYEGLREPRLRNLGARYFEECIRLVPHSEQSRRCYGAYESSVERGFSGSGGEDVPPETEAALRRLALLAR